mmetsp:Transcript_15245/g.57582  ORF Transcript_15245/g.57582 Transcript_15245/m.57582 type:complete len:255 (-) Transcript_15245:2000-2764(-)
MAARRLDRWQGMQTRMRMRMRVRRTGARCRHESRLPRQSRRTRCGARGLTARCAGSLPQTSRQPTARPRAELCLSGAWCRGSGRTREPSWRCCWRPWEATFLPCGRRATATQAPRPRLWAVRPTQPLLLGIPASWPRARREADRGNLRVAAPLEKAGSRSRQRMTLHLPLPRTAAWRGWLTPRALVRGGQQSCLHRGGSAPMPATSARVAAMGCAMGALATMAARRQAWGDAVGLALGGPRRATPRLTRSSAPS